MSLSIEFDKRHLQISRSNLRYFAALAVVYGVGGLGILVAALVLWAPTLLAVGATACLGAALFCRVILLERKRSKKLAIEIKEASAAEALNKRTNREA